MGDTTKTVHSKAPCKATLLNALLRLSTWVMDQRSQGLQQVPFAKFPAHRTQKLFTSEGCVPVTPERKILKKHLPVVPTVEEAGGYRAGQTWVFWFETSPGYVVKPSNKIKQEPIKMGVWPCLDSRDCKRRQWETGKHPQCIGPRTGP